MANTFNITTIRNDTYEGYSARIIKNGVPLNLSGAVIRMQLKRNAGDECYALEFSSLSTVENVITLTAPLSGVFTVEPQIISLVPRAYVYDTQITTASNEVITFLKGTFTVEQDITN